MLKIFAPAKINLHLQITGKRSDGYHYLDSLVAFTDIGDYLTLSPAEKFKLEITGPFAATLNNFLPATTSVEKAARNLAQHLNRDANVHITLEKNIPLGAGLGGGSADAAACLNGLNQFWNAKVTEKDLHSIGLQIGADVPVCISGKASIIRGIGDIISPAPPMPIFHAVLVWPGFPASTPEVYKNFTFKKPAENFSFKPSYTEVSDLISDLNQTRNKLQPTAVKLCPDVVTAIKVLEKSESCHFSRMSGSGSSVFGIFETAHNAQHAARKIAQLYPDWWVKSVTINSNI